MRFIFGALAVVVFIVVAIVIIATHNPTPSIKPINLDNYNNPSSSVSQTTNGLLVGDPSREGIRITVSQSSVEIDLLSGYEGNIAQSETFSNTSAAYSAFLGALKIALFTSSRTTNEASMFGVCPLGDTYQYELSNNGSTVFDLWSTSCSIKDGTFNGEGSLVRQLFQAQISNYATFTQNENNF